MMDWNRLNRHEDAGTIVRELIEVHNKFSGPRDQRTIDAMSQYGETLFKLHRFVEAEVIESQVYQLRQEILGAEHPSTILAMQRLWYTLDELRRHEEADYLIRLALQLKRLVTKEKDEDALQMIQNVAGQWYHQKRYEAEALKLKILEIKRNVLGWSNLFKP